MRFAYVVRTLMQTARHTTLAGVLTVTILHTETLPSGNTLVVDGAVGGWHKLCWETLDADGERIAGGAVYAEDWQGQLRMVLGAMPLLDALESAGAFYTETGGGSTAIECVLNMDEIVTGDDDRYVLITSMIPDRDSHAPMSLSDPSRVGMYVGDSDGEFREFPTLADALAFVATL